MKIILMFFFGLTCFLAGVFVPGVVTRITYPGADVRCIEGGQICVGMTINQALSSFAVEEPLGGMFDLTCGFTKPGAGALNHIGISGLLNRVCEDSKLVVSFTKGGDLTNLWIEGDQIVRIDRYPRHSLDL